jgi:hypothetical protein
MTLKPASLPLAGFFIADCPEWRDDSGSHRQASHPFMGGKQA